MPEFTCATCGKSFSLPQATLDRYPGWKPKQCRACRDRARGIEPAPMVEDNLTLEQVLRKYTGGPQEGVFTDGSANPNPGPGGWGAVYVVDGEVVNSAWGQEEHTTNNRMELRALIAGYHLVPPGTPTTMYSDSRLVVRTITEWADGWEKRGWRRKTGDIANLDLVQEAYALAKKRPEIKLEWIRAHNGALWNEYADSLSTAYLRETV
jgi:ribonuclease HI